LLTIINLTGRQPSGEFGPGLINAACIGANEPV